MSERTAHCQHCGDDWTPPPKAGFPPMFCSKRDCQEARRLRRNAQINLAKKARRRQRQERNELIAQVMDAELAEISHRADVRRLAARFEVGQDVRRLATATGDQQTYDALLDLAADALAFATRIRPDAPLKLAAEEPAEDYGELMVA